jgi:hypothetical protein
MKLKRRTFVFGAVLLGVGVAPLGRIYLRSLEDRAGRILRTLCDHFVPGHDDVPGAVALGVDRDLVEKFHATRRARLQLLLLTHDLDSIGFLALPPDQQRGVIHSQLELAASGDTSRRATMLDAMYRECVQRYLTNPDAWPSIRYRTPQPHGYPDYTECATS